MWGVWQAQVPEPQAAVLVLGRGGPYQDDARLQGQVEQAPRLDLDRCLLMYLDAFDGFHVS